MITKWTTSKPVIGNIVRNIRNMDGSYFEDIKDWMAEAVGKMETRFQLELVQETVCLKFHHARIPCDVEGLIAVMYNGRRLSEGNNAGPLKVPHYRGNTSLENLYASVVKPKGATDSDKVPTLFDAFDLQSLDRTPFDTSNYYQINYNKIESNLETGELNLFILRTPTDEEGFPMIPDQEDYKTAIYWYCRMMMIGAGYQDAVFNYVDCEQRWETHCRRAINAITYPSVDAVARAVQNNVRLMPNDYSWDSFNHTGSVERNYLND